MRRVPVAIARPAAPGLTRRRLALPLIVAAFYGSLFAVRSLGFTSLYTNLLYGLGIVPFDFPFVDAHAILAAAECHRAGIAIYPTNPCDALLRPLPYSPLWLDLIPRFMTIAHTPGLGIGFVLTFFAGLYLVIRPSSGCELLLMALASTSTCVTFAIERGNADLLIFALAAGTAGMSGLGPNARLAAYALGFAGGTLKFYPFVLLSLAFREPAKRLLTIAATSVLGLVAFGAYYYRGIQDSLGAIPSGAYFGDCFNAQNLPFGIADLGGYDDAVAWTILAGLVAACLSLVTLLARRFLSDRSTPDLSMLEARALLTGSLLIVGCFFAGQSVGYRGIFLLLVLPGLLQLGRGAGASSLQGLLRLTTAAVLFLLWEEGIRHSFEWGLRLTGVEDAIPGIPSTVFWVLRELVWWWVVSVLAAMVALFALQSPLGREAARVFYPAFELRSRP
jgi:hypothetical protein